MDQELFQDIIPFIQSRYNISEQSRERAIAGLSMGGLQALETGMVHRGYFDWIGAFSPAVWPQVLSEGFKAALQNPDQLNGSLRLVDIINGDSDGICGKAATGSGAQLKQANIQHAYMLVPGGTHSMFVWRPALYHFLQKVFKP